MSRKTLRNGRVFAVVAIQLSALGCSSYSGEAADAAVDAASDASGGPLDGTVNDATADAKAPQPDGAPDAKPDVNILDGGKDADATAPDAPIDGPLDSPIEAAPPDTGGDATPEAAVADTGSDAPVVVNIPQLAYKGVELISVSTAGAQANADCDSVRASDDKRFIGFFSTASNLVVGDTNALSDVFIRDRGLSTTKLVSVGLGGNPANGASHGGYVAASGSHVGFVSGAFNLVTGDNNAKDDIFVYDVGSGAVERVSVATGGAEANGSSDAAIVSDDGRFVAFESDATNLVTGDTNAVTDVFLRDRVQNTTIRVSVGAGGAQGNALSRRPHLSGDGRFVVYESDATNLVASDTNGVRDIFLYTVSSQVTVRLSETSSAVQGNALSDRAVMSSTGLYGVFRSASSNLVTGDTNNLIDLFRVGNSTPRELLRLASVQTSFGLARASISTNGNIVAAESLDTFGKSIDQNNASDIFVWDLSTIPAAAPNLISCTSSGSAANGASIGPFLTSDGSHILYRSSATNLNGITDTNGFADVFLSRVLP